jgi:glycosyltransferase involved in cell wall biosynthesis
MEAAAPVTASPRVVLGLPAYERPDSLPQALESLLSQSFQDFALIVVDDSGSADVAAVVESYARDYPCITYETNPRRLGMVGNWRKVFALARQRYPQAPYFAWVSDHDVWHARWLEEMVGVLDRDPDVVLAYPESLRLLVDNVKVEQKGFETVGIASRGQRMATSALRMLAGDMIYGVMRADALARAGVFRHVVTPDRQVLLALSLFGRAKQVPKMLWYREYVRGFDIERQREVFFPDGTPLYVYAPSHVQHAATLLWDFAICGRGRPHFGRLAGAYYTAVQLSCSIVRQVARPNAFRLSRLARQATGAAT